MKHLFIGLCYTSTAQEYTKNLESFEGTWEYKSATETFRIYLKKGKEFYYSGEFASELIFGGQYYSKSGTIIYDKRDAVTKETFGNRKGTSISATNSDYEESEVNPNALRFVIWDDIKDKRGKGRLALVSTNPPQLRWQITGGTEAGALVKLEGPPEAPKIQEGWSVPTNVVLTKISGPPVHIEIIPSRPPTTGPGGWTTDPAVQH